MIGIQDVGRCVCVKKVTPEIRRIFSGGRTDQSFMWDKGEKGRSSRHPNRPKKLAQNATQNKMKLHSTITYLQYFLGTLFPSDNKITSFLDSSEY